MAEIFLGQTSGLPGFQKRVAIKRILPEFANRPLFVAMFLDEARIAATLEHPNIVRVYEVDKVEGDYFMAMEYIQGEDVRSIMRAVAANQQRLPIEHAVNIVINVCSGLHYAHEKAGHHGQPLNIIHRDVTPQNIIVTYDGIVKLLDFGIAKASNSFGKTRHGTLKGKIPYMSPEQCRGEELDRRSDLFSVGVVLYELALGRRLYRHKETREFELLKEIVEGTVMPPREADPSISPRLERILMRALEKDREARYQTARELQTDLEELAREQRMHLSPMALQGFMAQAFAHKIESLRAGEVQGELLAAHLMASPAQDLGSEESYADISVEFEDEEVPELRRRPISGWKLALLAVSGVALAVSGVALAGGVSAISRHMNFLLRLGSPASRRPSPGLSLPSPPVRELENATSVPPVPSTAGPENQPVNRVAVAAIPAPAAVPEPEPPRVGPGHGSNEGSARHSLKPPSDRHAAIHASPVRPEPQSSGAYRMAPKKLEVASIEVPAMRPPPQMPAPPSAEPPKKGEGEGLPPPPVTPLPPVVVVDGVVTGTIGPFVPKHAVVWLEGGNLSSSGHSKSMPTISQRGARFQPDFVVLTAGQTLVMPNDDRIVHNVFSVSPPKRFDLGHYPEGDSRSVRFETAGVVDLFCNIHDNMHATIVVTPSRFFAIAGADGHFTIDHVPAGSYRAVAYSPESAMVSTSLSVTGGATASVNLALRRR